ncbi:MAG: substrate-binding domain-containing protein [Spirochaetales bacterium]|nr:substrate-binding domain-containing protein [Spirochaetales bacterium]
MTNPFFAEVMAGVEEVAFEKDFGVLFSFTERKKEKELRILEDFTRRNVEGLILLSVQEDASLEDFVSSCHIPLMLFQRFRPAWPCDSLCTDDRHGGSLALDHLLALGHRRIAFLSGHTQPSNSAGLREAVYREKVSQLDPQWSEAWVADANYTFEGGYAATLRVLGLQSPRPTAFVAISDRVALGCLAALRQAGISVPEEISVVGYDNLSWLDYGNPPLTSVDHQAREQGRRMAERILLRGKKNDLPFEQIVLEPFLKVRGTTGPALT